MDERHWEINGNLDDEKDGISNYDLFGSTIFKVKSIFDQLFGAETMNKLDLYIDNATRDSGYTPITTPVLKKYIIIKLCISSESDKAQIIFQFAHELTHFVFYTYLGINKPRANEKEESICTAASLCTLKEFLPDHFEKYNSYVKGLDKSSYKKGADLALEINYDLENLKSIIIEHTL